MPTLELEKREVKTSKVYYAPCIKCGSSDITFDDYGYSSFNYAFGRCNCCKREVSFQCDTFPDKKGIIKAWNAENDLEEIANRKLTEALNLEKFTIKQLRAQAKELRKLKEQREKQAKNEQAIPVLKKVSSKGGKYSEPKVDKYELAENVFIEINGKGGSVL